MTKREEEEGHHHPLSGNGDDSPIIVGDSSTGVLRHMTAVPANSFYIAFATGSIGSDGAISVSHATSNPFQVGPAGHQTKVTQKWTLAIAGAAGPTTTISSTNGIVAKIKPGNQPSTSLQMSNTQFPKGYLLLVFSDGVIDSAELNGVNIWTGAKIEVDFH